MGGGGAWPLIPPGSAIDPFSLLVSKLFLGKESVKGGLH